MKRLLSVVVLCMLAQSSFSQWSLLSGYLAYNPILNQTPAGEITFDISPDNGLYVSSEYVYNNSPHWAWFKVLKSHDEGLTWSDCTIPNSSDITYCNGIQCIDSSELIGYVKGPNGNGIYASSDDGATWTKTGSTGADGYFTSGAFVDVSNGLVLHTYYPGKKSSLFTGLAELCKIESGIFSFSLIDTLDFRHGNIQIFNYTDAIIMCRDTAGSTLVHPGNNRILKTSDFGPSWTTLYKDTAYGLNHFLFTSWNDGIMVGDHGKILLTADGGISWNLMESGTTKNIRFVTLKNGVYFCVGDSGLILRKEVLSDTWQDISFGTDNYSKIRINDNFIGFILSYHSKIYKSDIPLGTDELKTPGNIEVFPNPCENEVSFRTGNPARIKRISIQNLTGLTLMDNIDASRATIDISPLSTGIYLISFNVGDRIVIRKIVKK